jgi:hypothetical protein
MRGIRSSLSGKHVSGLLNRSYSCCSRVYFFEQHDNENNISSSDSLFQSSLESPASDLMKPIYR